MNRPPSTAGKSTNMPKKNWYKAPGGKIVWPNEMKLFLVSRVKEHISVLEGDSKVDPQHKLRVWEQIYKALVRRGMPDSDVRAVKKVWAGLRASTVEVYRRMETKRRNTRSAIEVTDLQRAVHEVIELKNKLATSGNSVMPMPIKVKVEMPDEAGTSSTNNDSSTLSETMQLNDTQREQQHLQLRSQPIVVLRPLSINSPKSGGAEMDMEESEEDEPVMPLPRIEPKNVSPVHMIPTPPPSMPTPPPREQRVESPMFRSMLIAGAATTMEHRPIVPTVAAPSAGQGMSAECQRTYERIAEAELQIRLVQQKKEEQSLEFERQIYTRRLALMDADLKMRNIEIGRMVESHQNSDNNNQR